MSDEEFQEMIADACTKITDIDLADMLKVSRPTIDRWRRGVNHPHPIMRASVKRIIQEYLGVGQSG